MTYRALCLTSAIALTASAAAAEMNFNRIASFPVVANMADGEDLARESSAEIISASADGMTLVYSDSPLGVIGSFTYTEKSRTASSGDYNKNQYYGITAGPAYRINDWASIYGVVGVGYGKFQTTEYPTYKHDTSDYGFSYGAGLQFNPMENVALDFSYEQSRIRSVDVGTWIAGVGYRF